VRVHFILEPDSPDEFERLGLLAEQHGFEAVWAPNILSARDPFLAFAPLARASQRIRMGPVAVSPFELHPLKMANLLFTLNELSGGRANLVVGGGGGTLIGMRLKPARTAVYPRMVRGVRECLELLRGVSAGKPLSYAGEVFGVDGYQPSWATQPPPLLYVAANEPQMLRLGGRLADGVMLSDIPVGRIGPVVAAIREGLARRATPAPAFRINNLLAWHVKPDREEAYREARTKLWVRGIWQRSRIAPYLAPADCDRVAASLPALAQAYQAGRDPATVLPREILDRLVDGMTLTGVPTDIDAMRAPLRELAAAGVNELGLRLYGEPAEAIRLVGERLAPALA